jgi:hypothetical protein
MAPLRIAAFYFALVFGTGFVLGPIRVLLLEPRIGRRAAELIELPLMLVAIYVAARWTLRRDGRRPLRTGLVALALVLTAELAVGVSLRGLTPLQVLTDRDPVSGTAYFATLAVFGGLPWWLRRRQACTR